MRVVDLTLPIQASYPHRAIAFETISTIENRGAAVTRVTFDTHWGTHVDTPRHTIPGARPVDQLDLAACCGPAVVVDLTVKGAAGDTIEVDDLVPHAAAFEPGARVLLRTDWSQRFGGADYHQRYPVLSVAAAQWLAARGIALLGVDVPSVGPVYGDFQQVIAVHQALLTPEIVIVECLAHLGELPATTFTFVAAPLPFVGFDGSPVRALALVD